MEGITLTTQMEFHNPHEEEEEVEPMISIQSQQSQLDERDIAIESMAQSSDTQQPHMDGHEVMIESVARKSGSMAEGPMEESGNLKISGEIQEPILGLEFESPDAARAFYSAYAEQAGFRVRNSKSFTSRVDDTVIMRRFVCSKQGRPTKKDPFDLTKKRRNRVSSREGCKAMMQVNRRENGRWSISRCVLEHCHPLGIASKPSLSAQKKLAKKPWELIRPASTTESQQNGLGPGGVGIVTLPDEYILRRWTRNAKDNILSYEHCTAFQSNCLKALNWRCNDLCRDAIRFAEEGATSAVIYKVAKGALQNAFNEIFAAKRGSSFNRNR
ncbi:uncharacterized protein A4U43_C09F4200 [Asparagus officinalis]|uniref:FAR1 domain-containing protein n=1 Tax=Asparagus officinalis TaxID=4686 RepID=A0A5P1E5H8_ASPOF|nr:uncharacterized protein A4U43_C09F4200 [Asparagus officinalis]